MSDQSSDHIVFCHPNPTLVDAAYRYLRPEDEVPSYENLQEDDPICRVKLFLPGSRYTYYVAAATNYEGVSGPVLTGYCISPIGPDCDEWGDQAIMDLIGNDPAQLRAKAARSLEVVEWFEPAADVKKGIHPLGVIKRVEEVTTDDGPGLEERKRAIPILKKLAKDLERLGGQPTVLPVERDLHWEPRRLSVIKAEQEPAAS